MPQKTFRVTDPATGRKIKMTGDQPPTEEQIKSAFASLPPKPAAPTDSSPAAPERTWGDTASDAIEGVFDFGKGVVKSALGTIEGGGNLIREYVPGVKAAEEVTGAYVDTKLNTQPSNAIQSAGKLAGDVGQFFIPGAQEGAIANFASKAPRLAAAFKAGGLSAAQGAGPVGTGLSAGLSAVLPGATATRRLAGGFEKSAERSMAQSLGPTKEGMKATAAELAPEMLERGVSGTRTSMLASARTNTKATGEKLGAEIQRLAAEGKTVPGDTIRQALSSATKGLTTVTPAGEVVAIEGMQPVLKQLGRLDEFVASLGPDIPFDQAAKVKTAWDRIVSKAGLFGPKVGASATDSAKAWAFREGAGSFRKTMGETGGDAYAALNKEYKFWKGLRTVLSETERRQQAQGTGLVAAGMAGVGGIGGVLMGDESDSLGERLAKVGLGAAAGRQFVRLMQSPYWRTTVTGPAKQKLADALATDSAMGLASAARGILASLPAQVSSRLNEE